MSVLLRPFREEDYPAYVAIKLRTVTYARERGYREIRTWNDVRNQPRLRIHEAMGFQKQPVWIGLRKELGEEK